MSGPQRSPSDERRQAEHNSGQARAARKAFAEAYAAGQVSVRDRFGRSLRLNDLVVYNPLQPLAFQVKEIAPVLDPNLPPGLLRVTLDIEVPIIWQAGHSAPELIVVGAVQSEGHAEINATRPADAPDPLPDEAPPPDDGGGVQ